MVGWFDVWSVPFAMKLAVEFGVCDRNVVYIFQINFYQS